MTSLAELVRRCHERYGTERALLTPTGWRRYSDVEKMASSCAGALAELGAGPGDRVVVAVENRPELVALDHALFGSGRVRVALGARLRAPEVAAIVQDCQARVLVCEPALAEVLRAEHGSAVGGVAVVTTTSTPGAAASLEELFARGGGGLDAAPDPDDAVAIMYTSGSTGDPKGAIVTDRAWVAMVAGLWAELPPIGPGDIVLHVAPMSHFSGSVGSAYTLRGAGVVTLARYSPEEVLALVERHRVSALPLVPTMLKEVAAVALRRRHDLSSIRAIPYGGAAIAPAALASAYRAFGDVLYQFYGLSEALVPLSALSAREHATREGAPPPARLGSAGRPTPWVAVRIAGEDGRALAPGEPGEIQVRGDVVTPGYWGRPAASVEAFAGGWFRTGDLGRLDPEGYLHILDRCRDVIVTGGYTVYAAEVERAIESLDAVAEVAVVGAPHERWGEAIVALVVRRPGHDLEAAEVIEACRAKLAAYKQPVSVEFVPELPRTSTGKVSRRVLRERFWRDRARKVGE
ncbi:MAG TPA: AMP-binding protein [Acidimicrobiales bacterium]|nr:AMP-binding protein [Acidimicrobiales bacterium]